MEPLLRLAHVFGTYRPPANAHGTYVAGILAADWRVADAAADNPVAPEAGLPARQVARTGDAPSSSGDLRVLGDDGKSVALGARRAAVRALGQHAAR